MTYNEWRDELKDNLLSVSEDERKRVLAFYAEAYADKREAGQSERDIINDFGAPYDAARRILEETETPSDGVKAEKSDDLMFGSSAEQKKTEENLTPPPAPAEKTKPADMSWLFVLLCIVCALPIFFVVLGLSLATLFIALAPIAAIGGGASLMGTSIGIFISGAEAAYGFYVLGCGIAILGAGIALCPLCFRLVKLLWKVFKNLFTRIKLFFKGRAV